MATAARPSLIWGSRFRMSEESKIRSLILVGLQNRARIPVPYIFLSVISTCPGVRSSRRGRERSPRWLTKVFLGRFVKYSTPSRAGVGALVFFFIPWVRWYMAAMYEVEGVKLGKLNPQAPPWGAGSISVFPWGTILLPGLIGR